jgi:acylphosphatase
VTTAPAAGTIGDVTDRVARDLIVHGRVQGVFFRAFVRDAARRAGVAGRAVNRPDGTVAVRLEGPADAVAQVERACARGPHGAHVERVESSDVAPEDLAGFDVG